MSLDYAWRVLGAEHVISLIAPENVASIRVAERLGESDEGTSTIDDLEVLVYGIDAPGDAVRRRLWWIRGCPASWWPRGS